MAASIPRTRLLRGELTAEIVLDRRNSAIVHCVVQRQGSPDVLFLEQFYTQEEAEAAAEGFFAQYFRKRPRARGSASAE